MLDYKIIDADVPFEHHHYNLKGECEINNPDHRAILKIIKVFDVPVLYVSLIKTANHAVHIYEYTDKKGELLIMMKNNSDIENMCTREGWSNMNKKNLRCKRNLKIL
jgi:hypothetical protein